MFGDGRAEGDLTVAAERDLAVAADTENRCGSGGFHPDDFTAAWPLQRPCLRQKIEIRNSNPENRTSSKRKDAKAQEGTHFRVFSFLCLELVSDFEFEISDLVKATTTTSGISASASARVRTSRRAFRCV